MSNTRVASQSTLPWFPFGRVAFPLVSFMDNLRKYSKLPIERLEDLLRKHIETVISLEQNISYYGATNSRPGYNGVEQLKIVKNCIKDIRTVLRQKRLSSLE